MNTIPDPFENTGALGRGRHLHFAAGEHLLARPWENFDRELDLRHPLPFPSACASHILAERVLERLPFVSCMRFLRECRRILEPTGVLRVSFADIMRLNEKNAALYMACLQAAGHPAEASDDIARFILEGPGRCSGWTIDLGEAALIASGFETVNEAHYGRSPNIMLDGIDGAHLTSSLTAVTIETTTLEACK